MQIKFYKTVRSWHSNNNNNNYNNDNNSNNNNNDDNNNNNIGTKSLSKTNKLLKVVSIYVAERLGIKSKRGLKRNNEP